MTHDDEFTEDDDDIQPFDDGFERDDGDLESQDDDEVVGHLVVIAFLPAKNSDDPGAWKELLATVQKQFDDSQASQSSKDDSYTDPPPPVDLVDREVVSEAVDAGTESALAKNRIRQEELEQQGKSAKQIMASFRTAFADLGAFLGGKIKVGWRFAVRLFEKVGKSMNGDETDDESPTR